MGARCLQQVHKCTARKCCVLMRLRNLQYVLDYGVCVFRSRGSLGDKMHGSMYKVEWYPMYLRQVTEDSSK